MNPYDIRGINIDDVSVRRFRFNVRHHPNFELGHDFHGMTNVAFICYVMFASLLRQKVLNSPKTMKAIKWCCAYVLLVLGLRLAFAEK